MKIGVISTHSFPITASGTITHTGDVVIADLVRSLNDLGHEVYFAAPDGSHIPTNGKLLPMMASFGKYPPSSQECEEDCFNKHVNSFLECDIIHDFSVSKIITEKLFALGKNNLISTIMGGAWTHEYSPKNLVVWTQSHRNRVLRGATDYENTLTPNMAGAPQKPVKEVHVVNGGVDTNFYTPTYNKKDFYLWMNRWHETKGYKMAIEVARKTGIKLVMAGEHPDREMFDYQKKCALEAIELAKDLPNVSFFWLPPDPDHHIAKRELYRQAKALLYTVQFHEPFGLSQTEALSCATPVIGTNYGSVPEIIKSGITGYVSNNNLDEYCEIVKKSDKLNYSECRKDAVSRFDRLVMAKNYLTEYQNIIDGKVWI